MTGQLKSTQKGPLIKLHAFSISSKLESLKDECPWLLGNTSASILETRHDSHKLVVDHYQKEGITANVNGLRTGLEMTFQALHESIALRDIAQLGAICEP